MSELWAEVEAVGVLLRATPAGDLDRDDHMCEEEGEEEDIKRTDVLLIIYPSMQNTTQWTLLSTFCLSWKLKHAGCYEVK